MNQTLKTLHDVSAFYFFVIGFIYVVSALAFRNGLFPDIFMTVLRIMDIPLAMVALGYGGSSLVLELESENEEGESPWTIVIFAACMLLFGIVVFINFAFPSLI